MTLEQKSKRIGITIIVSFVAVCAMFAMPYYRSVIQALLFMTTGAIICVIVAVMHSYVIFALSSHWPGIPLFPERFVPRHTYDPKLHWCHKCIMNKDERTSTF